MYFVAAYLPFRTFKLGSRLPSCVIAIPYYTDRQIPCRFRTIVSRSRKAGECRRLGIEYLKHRQELRDSQNFAYPLRQAQEL